MATYVIDHGAYTYSATPTWPNGGTPVAQDGDGVGTVTAVPSVATIDFSTTTAVAGNTLIIAGATLTCVASGAAANQFNAGSGATLAANVASSINAATNTVSASATVFTPQLRDFCYARTKSGATSTVEIMTRAGSDNNNYTTNSFVAITTSGITPPVVQFAGGSSGFWGWLWNPSASFMPSAKAVGGYGVGLVNGNTAGRLLAGSLTTSADIVWLLANDRTLTPGASVTLNVVGNINIVLDANNVARGDTLGKKFYIAMPTNTNVCNIVCGGVSSGVGNYDIYLGSNVRNAWSISNSSTTGTMAVQANLAANVGIMLENIEFIDNSTSGTIKLNNSYQAGNNKTWNIRGCRFRFVRSTANYGLLDFAGVQTGTIYMLFEDCEFLYDLLGAIHPGIINAASVNNGSATYRLVNCLGTSSVSLTAFQKFSATTVAFSAYAENLRGSFKLDVASQVGLFGTYSTSPKVGGQDNGFALHQNIGPKKGFRLETPSTVLEWVPDGGFPTLSSFLPDGTYWSWRTAWSGSANHYAAPAPVEVVSLDKLGLSSDGIRTITMEMLVPSAAVASITNKHISLAIAYTNTSSNQVVETTYPTNALLVSATAVPTSSASWTLNSYPAYSAIKMSITTSASVKANTDISIRLRLHKECPTGPGSIFIDPEVYIA